MRTVNRSGLRKFPVLRDLFHVETNASRMTNRRFLCRSLKMVRRCFVAAKLLVARVFHAHTRKCPGVSGEVHDDKHGNPHARVRLRRAGFAPGVMAGCTYTTRDEWTAIFGMMMAWQGTMSPRRRHHRSSPGFSTASVSRRCTSLWTTPAASFADSHLPRVDDFLRSGAAVLHSRCGACRAKPVDKMPIFLTAKGAPTAWAELERVGGGSPVAARAGAVAYTGLFVPLEAPR